MEQSKKESRFPKFQERFRKLQGEMSNTEFADFLGLTRQTIGFYLNGNRIPDILVLRQIAKRCNVSSDWLIGLTDIQGVDKTVRAVAEFTGLSEESVVKLNDVRKKCVGPNLVSMFIDRLLSGTIFRFQCDVIHYASIVVQGGEKKKRLGREKRLNNQAQEFGSIYSEVKVCGQRVSVIADDAMRVYRDSAVRKIEGVVHIVIDEYARKLTEYMEVSECQEKTQEPPREPGV